MLGWEVPPHVAGGLGVACLALTRALSARGVDVLFVAPERPGLSPYGRPYGPDLFAAVARYAEEVAAKAAREPFDVVHAHDWMTFAAGREAATRHGRPLVVHVHSLEGDRSPHGPDPRIVAAEQDGFDAAAAVVCVSRFTAARLAREYRVDGARVRVVHNALPELPASPGTGGGARRVAEPVVLFLARVTAQKAPDHFLQAAARVAQVLPGVKFVVAGDGDLFRGTVERAAALGLARRVAFTGFLGPDDVERAYAEADVFVLPSLSEPFGLTALEAAARGIPVVLTRRCGAAEVLPDALRVDPWDVEDLANKILAVLTRPALARFLSREGRREARARSWAEVADEVRAVYAEVGA